MFVIQGVCSRIYLSFIYIYIWYVSLLTFLQFHATTLLYTYHLIMPDCWACGLGGAQTCQLQMSRFAVKHAFEKNMKKHVSVLFSNLYWTYWKCCKFTIAKVIKRSWEKRTVIWDLGKLFGALNFQKNLSCHEIIWWYFLTYPFPVMPISNTWRFIFSLRLDPSWKTSEYWMSSWCGVFLVSWGAMSWTLELQNSFSRSPAG